MNSLFNRTEGNNSLQNVYNIGLSNDVCDKMYFRTLNAVDNENYSFDEINSVLDRYNQETKLYLEVEYARMRLEALTAEVQLKLDMFSLNERLRLEQEILKSRSCGILENKWNFRFHRGVLTAEDENLREFRILSGYALSQAQKNNPNLSFVLSQNIAEKIEHGVGRTHPDEAISVIELFYDKSPSLQRDSSSYECGAVAGDLFMACTKVEPENPNEMVRLLRVAGGLSAKMENSEHYLATPEFKLNNINAMSLDYPINFVDENSDATSILKFPLSEKVALAYIDATYDAVSQMVDVDNHSETLENTLSVYRTISDLYPELSDTLKKYVEVPDEIEESIEDKNQDEIEESIEDKNQDEIEESIEDKNQDEVEVPVEDENQDEVEVPVEDENQEEVEVPVEDENQEEVEVPVEDENQEEVEVPVEDENQDEVEVPVEDENQDEIEESIEDENQEASKKPVEDEDQDEGEDGVINDDPKVKTDKKHGFLRELLDLVKETIREEFRKHDHVDVESNIDSKDTKSDDVTVIVPKGRKVKQNGGQGIYVDWEDVPDKSDAENKYLPEPVNNSRKSAVTVRENLPEIDLDKLKAHVKTVMATSRNVYRIGKNAFSQLTDYVQKNIVNNKRFREFVSKMVNKLEKVSHLPALIMDKKKSDQEMLALTYVKNNIQSK